MARTERSVVNWCQPNRHGISRLDNYFDPNERKYYLTLQNVERVIQEEIQRTKKTPEPAVSEPFGKVPNLSENREIMELENEIRDLQITNKAKDIVIERMQKERDGVFEQLLASSRKVGELETKLLQLESPNAE